MNAPLPKNIETMMNRVLHTDIDPEETEEWKDSLHSLVATHGHERAAFILDELSVLAQKLKISWKQQAPSNHYAYINTISVEEQPAYPGNIKIEEKIAALIRWNALAMVVRANSAYGELGGHIASYASAADLFEVGFNHFFRARENTENGHKGDLVFFQPHSAPGVYARAFLENRLTEKDLGFFRQELRGSREGAQGLCSYPHPYLMPDFWQFPTGSMGIGPISSIYQARFMHYLTHRKLQNCENRKVWGIFGDGEMDEPESMSALTLAAREKLDNLIWVVNCNLQRLDGPVRGNGQVIQELEKLFTGAGWNVIKVLWGSDWDPLFARDLTGALTQALGETVDGQMQTFAANDGAFNRDHFFGQNEALQRLVQGMTDEQIDQLRRGGHDIVKIYAAYAAAVNHKGQPTVILAHTKKGYGMGNAGQGRMTTHSQKKLGEADLIAFRDRFNLPLSDEQTLNLAFYRPDENSEEIRYLNAQREKLGGYLPKRYTQAPVFPVSEVAQWAGFALQAEDKNMSTTMAFVRMLGNLLKDKEIGSRIVPIVADEARTFGMANLFKQVGIYSCVGQKYEPEDIGSILSYREALDGQILEEGISEAGAISSWVAAATSYSAHGTPMLPFYIYYSMFGFQRIGDLIWAAADQRPRGFLIGATSGKTTLGGEGLQHQDGSSHIWSATIPNCKSYDPAFAGELAVIIEQGTKEMMTEQKDVFYYITVMNENYPQPSLNETMRENIIKGAYHFRHYPAQNVDTPEAQKSVTLLGSGAILTEVLAAAEELSAKGIACDVFSITSWTELARDGQRNEYDTDQSGKPLVSFIESQLSHSKGPIIAASDYVRMLPESIRAYMPAGRKYVTLGTDGFGRSDTRAELRAHFGVNAKSIVEMALKQLAT
ncbi:alpha-ketoglutarate dehydrogenase [Advenella sp. RU8]|uniref:alpha-ketoglutarate dehydrogenase n=1 Tax=Advenella sp. RU8 TaxID=3399575 RepID=UPI003AAD5DC8